MPPNVAQARRPQHRIGDGVQQDIGVGMAQKASGVGNLDPTQNQLPSGHQSVHIPAFTDADIHGFAFKTASANAKSAG